MAQGYCPCSPRSICSTCSKPSSVDGLVRNGGFKIKSEFKLSMCENEKKECSKLWTPLRTCCHQVPQISP